MWSNIIEKWVERNSLYSKYKNDIKTIFKKSFDNTKVPYQTYFGGNSSLNLMYKSIYLIGISKGKISMLVDTDISNLTSYTIKQVEISKNKRLDLFWVTAKIKDIEDLINDELIWEHYRIATQKVVLFSVSIGERADWIKGKMLLKTIYDFKHSNLSDVRATLEKQIKSSFNDSQAERFERLKKADKKPKYIYTLSKTFIRNPDVIVEVLLRAKGYCERCQMKAPFNRDSNDTEYLEVHHKLPLAENGDDTVENAIALCPNCHRHAHYGKKTFIK